jgi:Spx/MgsR family transcriptional regulator
MIEFYHYPGCSTCRKAGKWLENRGHQLKARDITLAPPSKDWLRRQLRLSGKKIADLLNKNGEQYRLLKLKDQVKAMTEDQVLELLSKNGKLIKRPLAAGPNKATIGFREEEFKKVWG